MADISLVSRVRTRLNYSYKHGENRKNTTGRATSAIWRIFAALNNPNIDGGKHVLAMFLN